MQFETYQQQRDGLIQLAGDLSAALKGVPEAKDATVKTLAAEMDEAKGKETAAVKAIPVADELDAVKAKLEEGQFRIALFAGFQCGKSTTFDALLGGQEISPRGQLVATSSAILYGQHTDDPALQGKAEVEWKDKRALLTILPPTILERLAEVPALKGRMEGIHTIEQLSEAFDLDKPQDLRHLRDACAKEWRHYLGNRGAYPDDLRAMLRVAVLMLAKYDRPAIKALRKEPNKRFPVEGIDRFVRFPKSWEGRSTQEKQDFSDEEALFVFVKRVRCYVNAPALKKIDCTLVDCPGLGASEYDKQVATEEIQDCDVVWFLLGDGRRDIGADELRNIRTSVKLKPDGLIFTMNVTESKNNLANNVAPSTCAKINGAVDAKGAKLRLGPDDITFYHARLALSAEQACRLREGTLTKASQKAIIENAQAIYDGVTKVEDALDGLAMEDLKKTGVFVKDPRLQNFSFFDGEGLNEGNVTWAREQSGIDALVDRIHAIVMRDKAKIILKTNGFDRVQGAFKAFEAKVTGLLDDLAKSKQEAEAKYEAQEKRISALGNAMQEALNSDELDIGDLAERLRREFVSEVLNPSRDETLAAIERRADTLMGLSDNELQNAIGGLLNDSIRNNLAAWRQSLKNGDSPAIQRFIDKIKKIVDRLNREFKAKAEAKGMSGAANAGDASISIGEIDLGIDWFEWISVASNALFFIPIGGWILRGLIAAGIAITSWFVGKSWKRNKFIESATEKITEGCRDFERSALPAKMEEMAEGMRKSCVANLQSAIRLRLEEEQKALKQLRQKLDSGDKDKDIARLNKVKTDIVAPFAKRLADFAKQLDAAF
ncbi:MAG TPA: hypothetical protein IAC79_07770 [Candidatus Spyradenecus faecavium]|uniref:Dynamin family protein n=1 Tax=Candidatus Spyradenecus faecavium TaxID=2840947 RepID=A0A9D1NNK5_9BACT|nr:hypothetical protein [Candidatus Spyradenecus faecavium]